MSLRRCGGADCCPMARAGDAFRLSLWDYSTRSITGRLPNARALARDASSRDTAFPPRISQLPVPRSAPQGTPDGPTLSQPGPPVQPQQQSRGAPPSAGPTLFMSLEQFSSRIDRLRTEIKQGQRASGVERLILPGELEYERRETRLRHGIPVHAETPNALRTFCEALGLDSPLAL